MAELATPTVQVKASFLAAMNEFRAEGSSRGPGATMIGDRLHWFGSSPSDPGDDFSHFVQWLVEQSLEDSPRPTGHVPSTTLWWVEEQEYLGRISIRHGLTASLRQDGGHIGYDVRPSARQRGHATAMLRAALPVAHARGIDPALVTCDLDNIASRTVIERNGGILENQYGDKLRFWLPTH